MHLRCQDSRKHRHLSEMRASPPPKKKNEEMNLKRKINPNTPATLQCESWGCGLKLLLPQAEDFHILGVSAQPMLLHSRRQCKVSFDHFSTAKLRPTQIRKFLPRLHHGYAHSSCPPFSSKILPPNSFLFTRP